MNTENIIKAKELKEAGLALELYEYIKPFLENNDPYALFFLSSLSLVEWNESLEEMDERRVELLSKAADGNVPEAMHQLSALYFVGDTVEMNLEVGKSYLNKSMDIGYSVAKYSVGLNKCYGSNGYEQNLEEGIALLKQAENENVEGASEALSIIMDEFKN